MKGALLIQTLPVEGKGGLLQGGCTYTMTAGELLDIVRDCHRVPKGAPLAVIGVGATDSLGDEVTYMGEKLYIISGHEGKIATRELDPTTKISFSQIALESIEGSTYTRHFDRITAPDSDAEAHEINHGGAFAELLKAIGHVSSAVVSVTAETTYIKSRAVCPIVKETGEKISPAVELGTMIKGGAVSDEHGVKTIMPQTILEQSFAMPETVQMVGIITGTNMAENVALKGLHLHSRYGHVLDLGALDNVTVNVTPVTYTIILLPERDKAGKPVWHTALQEKDMPSLTKLQRFYKARKAMEGTASSVGAGCGRE